MSREIIAYVCCICDWTDWPRRRAAQILHERETAAFEHRRAAKVGAAPLVRRQSFPTRQEAQNAAAKARATAAADGRDVQIWIEVLHGRENPPPPAFLPGADTWPLQQRRRGP